MISALKRLVTNNENSNKSDNSNSNTTNSTTSLSSNGSKITNDAINGLANQLNTASLLNNGMQMISQSLQKKFSKGVNYNMKIVIRGDCNVGKTCLWMRLQGQAFKELYETSEEIRVANINWNYKTTDDIVKVEVWDVVDRSKKKRNILQQRSSGNTSSLKLENSISEAAKMPIEASLDAEWIDVYKNTNGCILVYDITKQWTWDYIERELPKIPTHIPVLIIGNHRDMHHHRNVDELKCKYFCENLNRGSLGSAVRYTETSMRTGFGLKYIYKFFNVPFLQLQRESLMQQLETNAKEMDAICEELQQIEDNIDCDYDEFSQNLNTKRRQQQEENAKDLLKNAKTIEEARKLANEREVAAQALAEATASEPKKVINNIINKINTKIPIQPAAPQKISMSVTLDPNAATSSKLASNQANNSNLKNSINLSLEDMTHDEELNRFLEDPLKSNSKSNLQSNSLTKSNNQLDDDFDNLNNNPMVAAFKETLDSSDEAELNKTNKNNSISKKNVAKTIDISASEEETDRNSINDKFKKSPNKPNDFVVLNKSTGTNSSQDDANRINNSNSKKNPNRLLDSISTTSSMLNFDTMSQVGNSMTVSMHNDTNSSMGAIKLTNDDFEFLEKMTSSDLGAKQSKKSSSSKSDETKKSSSKKSSSNSKLIIDDLSDLSNETTKTKKKKSSKSSKEKSNDFVDNNDDISENSSISEKKEKKAKKSGGMTKSKSNKKISEAKMMYEEDDNEVNNICVKQDVDYDEI